MPYLKLLQKNHPGHSNFTITAKPWHKRSDHNCQSDKPVHILFMDWLLGEAWLLCSYLWHGCTILLDMARCLMTRSTKMFLDPLVFLLENHWMDRAHFSSNSLLVPWPNFPSMTAASWDGSDSTKSSYSGLACVKPLLHNLPPVCSSTYSKALLPLVILTLEFYFSPGKLPTGLEHSCLASCKAGKADHVCTS